jgi:hypothetical protein
MDLTDTVRYRSAAIASVEVKSSVHLTPRLLFSITTVTLTWPYVALVNTAGYGCLYGERSILLWYARTCTLSLS